GRPEPASAPPWQPAGTASGRGDVAWREPCVTIIHPKSDAWAIPGPPPKAGRGPGKVGGHAPKLDSRRPARRRRPGGPDRRGAIAGAGQRPPGRARLRLSDVRGAPHPPRRPAIVRPCPGGPLARLRPETGRPRPRCRALSGDEGQP